MKKVLVTATNYSELCAQGKKLLVDNGFDIIENSYGRPMHFDEIKTLIHDVDAVIAGVDTWDASIFDIATKLKIISRFGVGVDNIDVNEAKKNGIIVTNAAGMNANAVAELTIGLIISAMRRIPQLHQSTRMGNWERFVGEEVINKKVGILGFGNIARKVAKKLSGFDVSISAYDKYPDHRVAKELNVMITGWEEIITESDIIIVLLPSLKETYYFIDEDKLSMMKKKVYLINTSRGALINERALKKFIESGHINAAVDVYEHEPTCKDNSLFALDNVVTTPHTAAETYETYHSVGILTAEAIIDVFRGNTPVNQL